MQTDLFQDISRGRHNPESQLAHERLLPGKESQRERVFGLIDGLRCNMEIAEIMDKPLHKISGRFTELKAGDRIAKVSTKKYKGSTYAVHRRKC